MRCNRLRLAGLLTLPLWLGLLASCAPTSDACTGWQRVQLSSPSIDYLAAHDPQALAEMTGNQLYGRKLCGW